MLESLYAEAFVAGVLKGDATLIGNSALGSASKIYKNRATEGASFPLLIYSIQSSIDFNSLNQEFRLLSEYLFQCRVVSEVKGIDLQSADQVRTAANRMDELLRNIKRQSLTIGSVTLYFNVWREMELPVREEQGATADAFYRSYGGFYRVQAFA